MDEIDEVGGLGRVDIGRGQPQRLGLGAVGLRLRDGPGLHHRIEHQVAPLHGAVGMAIGIAPTWVLDQARDQSALRQIELPQVLPEERLGRLAEAVDLERPAPPNVHLVGVHLEDLLLVEARLKLEGDHDLDQLAGELLLRREEEPARQLHGERRSAALLVPGEGVLDGALGDAHVVDAAVLEEAAVLDGQHRLHHVGRDFVVRDQAALGAVLPGERGDQLRFKLVRGQRRAVLRRDGLHHRAAACARVRIAALSGGDGGAVRGVVALGAGLDPDAVAAQGKGAKLRVAVVAGLAQFLRDEQDGQPLAHAHLARRGVDLRGVGKDWTGSKPLVHDGLVLEVADAEDAHTQDHAEERGKEQAAQKAVLEAGKASAGVAVPPSLSLMAMTTAISGQW